MVYRRRHDFVYIAWSHLTTAYKFTLTDCYKGPSYSSALFDFATSSKLIKVIICNFTIVYPIVTIKNKVREQNLFKRYCSKLSRISSFLARSNLFRLLLYPFSSCTNRNKEENLVSNFKWNSDTQLLWFSEIISTYNEPLKRL
jgi:hypothetical protein